MMTSSEYREDMKEWEKKKQEADAELLKTEEEAPVTRGLIDTKQTYKGKRIFLETDDEQEAIRFRESCSRILRKLYGDHA